VDRDRRDFFVSYTSADQTWAEWIAHVLEDTGYTVVIQAWDFPPGSNFVIEMQHALQSADRVIAVLSPDYLAARYPQPEWAAAFATDPEGIRKRLIPVMVRRCEPDGLLSQVVQIRILDLDVAEATRKLLDGVRAGRAIPAERPAFPGVAGPGVATAESGSRLVWRRVTRPLDVVWRADLEGRRPNQLAHQAVELHLVPVGDEARLQVQGLRELSAALPAIGRQRNLFSTVEPLDVRADGNKVVVTATGREAASGLAVTRSGQRSAWQSLPHDMLGAVLDEEHVSGQLSNLFDVLRELPIPMPEAVVPVAGIEPAHMVAIGRIADLPRSQASLGLGMPQHVRLDAEDMVTFADLRTSVRDIAVELVARLVAELKTTARLP
jgi:hypothetical protein